MELFKNISFQGRPLLARWFRVFDFCFNFDYFRENPNGIEGSGGEALGSRLFKSRVQLLAAVQRTPELEPSGALRTALIGTLHWEVSGMNPDNFMVREGQEAFKNGFVREVGGPAVAVATAASNYAWQDASIRGTGCRVW